MVYKRRRDSGRLIYWYEIESDHWTTAQYTAHLLTMHGLTYPWQAKKTKLKNRDTIRIAIGRVSSANDLVALPSCAESKGPLLSEIYLTRNEDCMRSLGLTLSEKKKSIGTWGYLIEPLHVSQVNTSILMPLDHLDGTDFFQGDWQVNCYLIGLNTRPLPFSISKISNGVTTTVVAVSLLEFMDHALFGPKETSRRNLSLEDWADVYGIDKTQSIANTTYVDDLLTLICRIIMQTSQGATPCMISYYPPGLTAPIIITGDTDDATPQQLREYLLLLETCKLRASLLLKHCYVDVADLIKDGRHRGHCFGLHPYAASAKPDEYKRNYDLLSRDFAATVGGTISGVRNHRFQRLGRTLHVEMERKSGALFDLNCVAASGHTWLGTGSGVGFPVAYPPADGIFLAQPLHLPTIIEDDVLIFDHDYCYHSFETGDKATIPQALDYLRMWILDKKKPAVLNLHPEHVTQSTRILLDAILKWIGENNIWAPTLAEFGEWLKLRSETRLDVISTTADLIISVDAAIPITFEFLEKAEKDLYKMSYAGIEKNYG